LNQILKNKAINDWRLFWLITGPISIAMVIAMMGIELNSGPAVSSMIQLSVRCAVPLLYVVFAASSVQVLFPGPFGLWLSRNRKYAGLCFAAAMAWQGLFILWMVIVYSDYYINEVYVLRDAIEGVVGYLFLAAMTVTSFMPVRKRMKPGSWKLLHKSGIYFLWAYAFSVYWWNLFYYGNLALLDYVYYWGGFLAWGLRVGAWSKKRRKRAEKKGPGSDRQPAFTILGYVIIAVGLVAASFGSFLQKSAEQYLTGYTLTRWPELYLPYWPFEPFLALFVIALGAFLIAKSGAGRQPSHAPRVPAV
jgi:DMSO/TMAO reductase YedYZ heme-binding membrane subunit